MSTSLTLEKAGLQTEIALSPHELFNKLQLEIHTKKMLAVIIFSAFNRLIVGLFFFNPSKLNYFQGTLEDQSPTFSQLSNELCEKISETLMHIFMEVWNRFEKLEKTFLFQIQDLNMKPTFCCREHSSSAGSCVQRNG